MKPLYVTTAISYPNGAPHIGHAYEAIAADVYARFLRTTGEGLHNGVKLVTGTDEHGLKIAQTAKAEGLTPRQFVDLKVAPFIDMNDMLGVGYDRFIRTTDNDHKIEAQALWQKMVANGDLYLGKYSGWYSVRDEAYFDESEIVDGKAPTGNPVEWMEEETWFFRLSAYTDRIRDLLTDNPSFLQPASARNKVLADLENLNDISVSRTSFDWGIPVPDSPGHVMYVWVDALSNYLTGADDAWPADMHIIGKDIIKFHAVYWPAFLMSAGLELPKAIFAHGFLMNDGVKMSKSLGNVVDPFEEIHAVGPEALRYFLMREITFGSDGSYSREAVVSRCNAELSNGIGNLLSRTCALIHKKLDGDITDGGRDPEHAPEDGELLTTVFDICHEIVPAEFAKLNFSGGLDRWCEAVTLCDRYINDQKPWSKDIDPARLKAVLVTLVTALGPLLTVIEPIMPDTIERALSYYEQHPLPGPPPPMFPRLT